METFQAPNRELGAGSTMSYALVCIYCTKILLGSFTTRGMAEREGFEPSEHLVGIHTISSRAPSATRASLHGTQTIMIDAKRAAVKEKHNDT